jgi:hypothetical protein
LGTSWRSLEHKLREGVEQESEEVEQESEEVEQESEEGEGQNSQLAMNVVNILHYVIKGYHNTCNG